MFGLMLMGRHQIGGEEKKEIKKEYPFPVYGTQGGGLVYEIGGVWFFLEKPNCPGFDVGDKMPPEWSIVPANDYAQKETAEEQWGL